MRALPLVFVASILLRAAASAAACPPVARVDGDEPLASAIRDMLASRGVGSEVELPCPSVHATIRETAAGLTAVVRDEAGRERAYELRDRETAVTVVESWARHDLDGALAAARPVPVPLMVDVVLPPAPPPRRPFSIAFLAGTAHGSDGSVWTDGGLHACVKLEGVCAGLLVRASRDSGSFGDARRYGTNRTAADVLATVGLVREAGRFHLGGSFGFGGGWQQSLQKRQEQGASDGQDYGGLRVEARATGGVELARELDLELSLAGGVSPLADTKPLREPTAVIASEPLAWMRLNLGLRFGGP